MWTERISPAPGIYVREDLSMESVQVSNAVPSGEPPILQLDNLGCSEVGLDHSQAASVANIELVAQYVGTGVDVRIGVRHVVIPGRGSRGARPRRAISASGVGGMRRRAMYREGLLRGTELPVGDLTAAHRSSSFTTAGSGSRPSARTEQRALATARSLLVTIPMLPF
jgi:hypothetical protein